MPRWGEKNHKAKLTDEQVREARRLREVEGKTYKQIARAVGASCWTIRDIVTYTTRRSA